MGRVHRIVGCSAWESSHRPHIVERPVRSVQPPVVPQVRHPDVADHQFGADGDDGRSRGHRERCRCDEHRIRGVLGVVERHTHSLAAHRSAWPASLVRPAKQPSWICRRRRGIPGFRAVTGRPGCCRQSSRRSACRAGRWRRAPNGFANRRHLPQREPAAGVHQGRSREVS